MSDINNFIGFEEGDIVTLSDLQTQRDFGSLSADFRIKQVRTYREPNNFFCYTAYICEYPKKDEEDEMSIILLVRQMDKDFDLMCFYLDSEGDSSEFEALFTEDGEDLENRFDSCLSLDEGEVDVTWDKKNSESTFGVEVKSGDKTDQKTIAEYYTADEAGGNNHAFIEWTGDKENGYLEIWYGCEIRTEDVEIYHTKKEV